MNSTPLNRIEWLSDLVRLEIRLWERVDARLRAEHGLPLAHFWPLYVVGHAPAESLRVGELAAALGLTVGGTSKVVDRIVAAGYLRREPDPTDRRASRLVLTHAGRSCLGAAGATCEAELAAALDAALGPDEQRGMHRLVRRLLGVTGGDAPA
ncbi:MAG TPA: MarR family winged helix-turn-helix transcriptional regulator [Thermomicrobiaceae bacterium]|nr:MarR family winged helix-turn-helix transcriptional regulator [Thermomicrobiaceae bacterium]